MGLRLRSRKISRWIHHCVVKDTISSAYETQVQAINCLNFFFLRKHPVLMTIFTQQEGAEGRGAGLVGGLTKTLSFPAWPNFHNFYSLFTASDCIRVWVEALSLVLRDTSLTIMTSIERLSGVTVITGASILTWYSALLIDNWVLQAAGGIGEETAYAFAEAGAVGIIFADINQHGAEESAAKSKKFAKHAEYRPIAVKVDVTNEQSVQAMVDKAIEEFQRIDYFVNSAGVCVFRCVLIINDWIMMVRSATCRETRYRIFKLIVLIRTSKLTWKAACCVSVQCPKRWAHKNHWPTRVDMVHAV